MKKMIKEIAEMERNYQIEEAKEEYEKKVSLIKEDLPKAASKKRYPLNEVKRRIKSYIIQYEGYIERSLEVLEIDNMTPTKFQPYRTFSGHFKPYGILGRLITARMRVKKLKEELFEIEPQIKSLYVRTSAQKKNVTNILIKEAKEELKHELKRINNNINEDITEMINSNKILTSYRSYITQEKGKENNLFFYFKNIYVTDPANSLEIHDNMIQIPVKCCLDELDYKNKRIVLDMAYDWSTSSGKAWGTRQAAFYAGMEDGTAFIERIPYGVSSIKEAEEWLKPAEVKRAEAEGRKVERQGDFFIIEMKRKTIMNIEDSHQVTETSEGLEISHRQHGVLKLPGNRWKAVQRKTMASQGVD